MFGIGLPELILIMAVALIVVGPEKLPELARGLGRQIVELKKAASALQDSLREEDGEDELDRDLPVGFSRPEELAAAGRKASQPDDQNGAAVPEPEHETSDGEKDREKLDENESIAGEGGSSDQGPAGKEL